MNFFYDSATDSLFIELARRPYADSVEVADGLVVDFDAEGRPIALDIQQASTVLDQPILARPPALPGGDFRVTPAALRQVRDALGLTQKDLATKLGVASNTVARWERGELAIEKANVGAVLAALMTKRPASKRAAGKRSLSKRHGKRAEPAIRERSARRKHAKKR